MGDGRRHRVLLYEVEEQKKGGEGLFVDGGVWDGIGGRRKEDISTMSLDELGSLGGGCVAGRCC